MHKCDTSKLLLYYIVHSINTTITATTTVKNIHEDLIIGSLVNFIYHI